MEAPKTLKEHFVVVNDFFKKTFREEGTLFVGLKAVQYANATPLSNVVATSDSVLGPKASPGKEAGAASKRATDPASAPLVVSIPPGKNGETANFFALSPRIQFLNSGSTVGKVKILTGVVLPHICQLEQGVVLSSNGMITGKAVVKEIIDGLEFGGRIAINTIASAAEDASVLHASYQRSDVFSALKYQRNGLGSSNISFDFGSRFLNLLVGAGFERQELSHVERETGAEQRNAMYVGCGFSGVDWSIGSKFTHVNGLWQTGEIAILQKLKPSTTVACNYTLGIGTSKAKVSLGFSQGMLLRLPYFFQPSNYSAMQPLRSSISSSSSNAPPPHTTLFPKVASVPLVFAFKAESDGAVSATLRSLFNNSIRLGLVCHHHLHAKTRPRLGVVLTLEQESL